MFVLFLSCKTTTPSQTIPAEENSLLWEISGKNLARPSYLYGTMHIMCAEDFKVTQQMHEKFAVAGKVYLELDMDNPGMLFKTMQLSLLQNGTLKDLFSESDYAKLNRFVSDSLGMPMLLLNKMKPFALMSLLYGKVLTCSKTESYEQTFVEMAKAQKKEVLGLETPEDQFSVFDQIPDSSEARMVMEFINNFEDQRQEFRKMVEAYKNQDIAELYRQMSNSPDMAGFEDELLIKRNQKWIPVMETAMQAGSTFFAVGAGHLPGQHGVIHLLRDKGYDVKAVK
jgi:uncharacterized protein